ncbi:MAG: sulfurtransferase [Actinobacteria bacterium]|nr:sulfurtransferase [Actinomycetota bacterium]
MSKLTSKSFTNSRPKTPRRFIWLTLSLVAVALPTAANASSSSSVSKDRRATIVEATWLEANLNNPKVRIIEVSTDPGVYEKSHIPNAINFRWHTEFVDPVNRDIASQSAFQAAVQAAGINKDTQVVLYGDKNNWFAAWGVWIFRTYGHQNVSILNGGRDKWVKDGRALSPIVPSPSRGNFVATTANLKLRAFLGDVTKIAKKQDKSTKLVDIRSADEFSGKIFAPAGFQELAIRAGHIPGAQNVPWTTAVSPDGTFRPAADLKAIYDAKGINGKKKVIVYCRIGERAAHTWFVLSEILGYDVKLYDGSWTEYGNSVGVPIANPTGTVWGKG